MVAYPYAGHHYYFNVTFCGRGWKESDLVSGFDVARRGILLREESGIACELIYRHRQHAPFLWFKGIPGFGCG